MKDVKAYKELGVLEMYALGMVTGSEALEVEEMALRCPEIGAELEAIGKTMEKLARQQALPPPVAIKPMVLATINYMSRLQAGEMPAFPPKLHAASSINDYSAWLNRSDLAPAEAPHDIFVRIIGYSPQMTTAIVWIREMAPQEVHDNEYERFLVVEGTCDITIGNEVHRMGPGHYLQIPLHTAHHVTVTSAQPCKVILQREAA